MAAKSGRLSDLPTGLVDEASFTPAPPEMCSGLTGRVLIDARMPAYTSAGITRYVQGLLTGLAAFCPQHVAALLARSETGTWWQPLNAAGVEVHRALTPCHHRLERWTLPLEAWRHRPVLFHAVDHVAPSLRSFPTVVTVHDLAFWRYPWTHHPDSRRHYAAVATTLPSAEAVICVSAFIRAELLAMLRLDPQRVHVVPNGLGPRFQPRPDRALLVQRYGLTDPYILAVGTVEDRKNLNFLLDAFRQLNRQNLQLVVAGADGWGAERFTAAVQQSGMAQRVHRLGRPDDRALVALYSTAALLAFPSLYEGFAFPPLEAMACGTPVVALDTGPLPEVCGTGAEAAADLVEPRADRFAAAMARLLDDPDHRRTQIERGRRRAAQFSWRRCAEQTVAVYRQVARPSGRGHVT